MRFFICIDEDGTANRSWTRMFYRLEISSNPRHDERYFSGISFAQHADPHFNGGYVCQYQLKELKVRRVL